MGYPRLRRGASGHPIDFLMRRCTEGGFQTLESCERTPAWIKKKQKSDISPGGKYTLFVVPARKPSLRCSQNRCSRLPLSAADAYRGLKHCLCGKVATLMGLCSAHSFHSQPPRWTILPMTIFMVSWQGSFRFPWSLRSGQPGTTRLGTCASSPSIYQTPIFRWSFWCLGWVAGLTSLFFNPG